MLAILLAAGDRPGDGVNVYEQLHALDRLASAGMWLVVHQTYARSVYLDGRALEPADFKARPEGHTGGALNMAPAYAAHLAVNALTGVTRGWLMGQGHCVTAIDTINVLVGNMTPAHAPHLRARGRAAREVLSPGLAGPGAPATTSLTVVAWSRRSPSAPNVSGSVTSRAWHRHRRLNRRSGEASSDRSSGAPCAGTGSPG